MQKQHLVIVGDRAQSNLSPRFEEFETHVARTCSEARLLLAGSPAPSHVLTDVSLPDGNWCEVLRLVVQFGFSAEVQVLGPVATAGFRSEVEARGGRCVRAFEPMQRSSPFAPEVRVLATTRGAA